MRRALLLLHCALMALCMGCANSVFYQPTRDVYQTPARYGMKFEDVTFHSKDGTKLHGWFVPAAGDAIATVIHFHGNAQNMSAHFSFVKWLPAEGFNVFCFDYRGYGKSEGRPGRQGIYEDSVAAIEYVKSRTDVDQARLLVLGQSLGGANAIAAVGENDFDGIRAVVSECTFYSYRSIARDKIGLIPIVSLLKWPLSFVLVTNGHSPGDAIDRISPTPLMLIHGTADRVVPYHHGLKLKDKAREPKRFVTITDGRHTQAFTESCPQGRRELLKYFKAVLQKAKGANSSAQRSEAGLKRPSTSISGPICSTRTSASSRASPSGVMPSPATGTGASRPPITF